MIQELISTQDQGDQIIEIRHQSGTTVYAKIPAEAEADAPFIHAWLRNQQSDRTQKTYAANISRFYREVRKGLLGSSEQFTTLSAQLAW